MINKHELIDVATRSHGFKGVLARWVHQIAVDTPWSQEGCVHWNVVSAFSGKCPVQVNQVSITENMLDAAREECNKLELRRWHFKRRRTDCRRAQLWSETEKCGLADNV